MGSAELKTEASRRWMMYSRDAYQCGRIFLSAEQKQAVEEGQAFSQRAYADVWAKDAALVRRVRSFLRQHFHWHQRLANSAGDLEVIQTLQSMIRGQSVVLVAEQAWLGGSPAVAAPAVPTLPSFRESLMTQHGMSFDAATDYMKRYNVSVARINAALARSANKAAAVLANEAADFTDIATLFGDARAFEYMPEVASGNTFDLAKTPNEGNPGTWYTNPGSGQMRMFGSDGRPAVDFDFDHDHGQGTPHSHNWGIDPLSGKLGRGPGLPFSLLP
jgi:hypothetical protein